MRQFLRVLLISSTGFLFTACSEPSAPQAEQPADNQQITPADPIAGSPLQHIDAARQVRSVAVLGCDYHGMKPSMAVQVGDLEPRLAAGAAALREILEGNVGL